MAKILIVEQIIFYLALLFLPTQLGRHFWPTFSSVLGVRVDYLSPTLYFTDTLIFLLFLSFIFRKVMLLKINLKFKNLNFKLGFFAQRVQKEWRIPLFLVLLTIGIINAKNPFVSWYGLLKFLEFLFFGLYVAFAKIRFEKIAFNFSFGVIFESALAILQYLHQGSLGGLFYFFGERTFSSQTPGIANASLNGELILRPYGTLPHPNVLGGYLTIALAMIISNFQLPSPKGQALLISNFRKIIYGVALVVGTVALVLTMSRVAIILWFTLLIIMCVTRFKRLFFLPLLISFIIFFFSPLSPRLTSLTLKDESVVQRISLLKASFLMVKEHPIFGVGLNNFLVNLPVFQMQPPGVFTLQPVHNVYLLVAAETGIFGLAFFLWFLGKTYKRIKNKELRIKDKVSVIHNSLFIILSAMLILGVFDHYFLTLQQGRMLFAFVLGLCWTKKLKE